jgi:hypothetical protein
MMGDGKILHTWTATILSGGKRHKFGGTDRMFLSLAPANERYAGQCLEAVVKAAADKEFGPGNWSVGFRDGGPDRWAVPASDYGFNR